MAKLKQTVEKKKQKHSGISINTISRTIFLMFVFVLTAGLYLGQQDPLSMLADQRKTVANSTTTNTALKFTNQVETYSQALNGLARDPALVELFSTKNLQAL
ncbi:MAG: hypothetical protein OEY78_03355, partial [Gammaproteobacteria bacterium]|nr:hypothetical protein [Gammaproteobacteria bacterium]